MLPIVTVVATGAAPAERDYRLTVRAAPATGVALRANVPNGWIVAFCTPALCASGHVVVHVPQSGAATIALHVYRVQDRSQRRRDVVIQDSGGGSLTLRVSF